MLNDPTPLIIGGDPRASISSLSTPPPFPHDHMLDVSIPKPLHLYYLTDGDQRVPRSKNGIVVMWGGIAIVVSGFRQHSQSMHAYESECFAASAGAAVATRIASFCHSIGYSMVHPIPGYTDSGSTVAVATGEAHMRRSAHIRTRIAFLLEASYRRLISVYACVGKTNPANPLTKFTGKRELIAFSKYVQGEFPAKFEYPPACSAPTCSLLASGIPFVSCNPACVILAFAPVVDAARHSHFPLNLSTLVMIISGFILVHAALTILCPLVMASINIGFAILLLVFSTFRSMLSIVLDKILIFIACRLPRSLRGAAFGIRNNVKILLWDPVRARNASRPRRPRQSPPRRRPGPAVASNDFPANLPDPDPVQDSFDTALNNVVLRRINFLQDSIDAIITHCEIPNPLDPNFVPAYSVPAPAEAISVLAPLASVLDATDPDEPAASWTFHGPTSVDGPIASSSSSSDYVPVPAYGSNIQPPFSPVPFDLSPALAPEAAAYFANLPGPFSPSSVAAPDTAPFSAPPRPRSGYTYQGYEDDGISHR